MVKKRIIGVVTIKQGWAVQSFGYHRYLPLGHPHILVENLDRWGADEILVKCIDRYRLGPDFTLVERLGSLGLSTPLIYGGGIRNCIDASKVVAMGADRILLDTMLWECPSEIKLISEKLGTQAVIANLPVNVNEGKLFWMDYRTRREFHLSPKTFASLPLDYLSEIMLSDWTNEGVFAGFDERILELSSSYPSGLILFGGLSDSAVLQRVLARSNVAAVGIGNFLSYTEHAMQGIRNNIHGHLTRQSLCERKG